MVQAKPARRTRGRRRWIRGQGPRRHEVRPLCQLLKGIRKEAGLTAVQMGTRLGLEPEYIYDVERGAILITQTILDGYGALVDRREKTEGHEGHS